LSNVSGNSNDFEKISPSSQLFIDNLLMAEDEINSKVTNISIVESDCSIDLLSRSTLRSLNNLVYWAQKIPMFNELTTDDKVNLLRASMYRFISYLSFISLI
jgi:hypothetical protein